MQRTCQACGNEIQEGLPEVPLCPSCLASLGLEGPSQAYLRDLTSGADEPRDVRGPNAEAGSEVEDDEPRRSDGPDAPDENGLDAPDEDGPDACAPA